MAVMIFDNIQTTRIHQEDKISLLLHSTGKKIGGGIKYLKVNPPYRNVYCVLHLHCNVKCTRCVYK